MRRLVPVAALLAACGGTSTPAQDGGVSGDAGTTAGGDAGAASTAVVGAFQVRLVEPAPPTPGYTSVFGKVYDGPTPQQIVWVEKRAEGACRLLEPRVPFCNPPCGGTAACVEDDTCQAYPRARSAGTVTVKGLRPMDFTMSPVSNNYQVPVGLTLPYPALDEGATMTLEASGADPIAAFTLTAPGVAPVVLAAGDLTLERGKPLALSWTPPGTAGLSTVHVKLDISHHGGTKGMIDCDAADTGALALSAPMVTDLLNLGVAGFPTVVVTRAAKRSTPIAQGMVELVVLSEVETAVKIPGLTSCTQDLECPMGTTCQPDLSCK